MDSLPLEIIEKILGMVPEDNQAILKTVCRTWYNISKQDYSNQLKPRFYTSTLALAKWARGNGCPWNGWTCASAAAGGLLEVLKWARENGCPWDD